MIGFGTIVNATITVFDAIILAHKTFLYFFYYNFTIERCKLGVRNTSIFNYLRKCW